MKKYLACVVFLTSMHCGALGAVNINVEDGAIEQHPNGGVRIIAGPNFQIHGDLLVPGGTVEIVSDHPIPLVGMIVADVIIIDAPIIGFLAPLLLNDQIAIMIQNTAQILPHGHGA